VRDAYGKTADTAYRKAVDGIRDPAWLRQCMNGMAMDENLSDEILSPHWQ
jgi:hypothetical protein